jgi:hypothetical protein
MPSGRNLLRLVASALAPGMGSVLAGRPWRGVVFYVIFLGLRRYAFLLIVFHYTIPSSALLIHSALIWLIFACVDNLQVKRRAEDEELEPGTDRTSIAYLFISIGLITALVLLVQPLHIGLIVMTILSMLVGRWFLAGNQTLRASSLGLVILAVVIVPVDFVVSLTPDPFSGTPGIVACHYVRDFCTNDRYPHSHTCFLTHPLKVTHSEAIVEVITGGDCFVYVPGGSTECFSASFIPYLLSIFSNKPYIPYYPTFFHASSGLGYRFVEPFLAPYPSKKVDFVAEEWPLVLDTMTHTVHLQRIGNQWKVVSCSYGIVPCEP